MMEQTPGNQPTYRVVNRWSDTLKINIKGHLPKALADVDQVQHYQGQAREEATAPETIGSPMGPRPLTAEEWQHLHALPDFKLLLDWLSRDHPNPPIEQKWREGQSGPDAA